MLKRLKNGLYILLVWLAGGVYGVPAASGGGWAAAQKGVVVYDTLLQVRTGNSLSGLAARFLAGSPSFSRRELVAEIKRRNDLPSDLLQPGQELRIPLRRNPPLNRAVARPRGFAAKGIYVNAPTAGSERIFDLVERLVAAGGNTVVVDFKDRRGRLSYVSGVPLAVAIGASGEAAIQQPDKLIEFLHRRQIHVIARVVCFYDTGLARKRPDLVPLSRAAGGAWTEKGEADWIDPSLPEVQEYLLALIAEVAAMGVDEIQLDYIRFPTDGDDEDAVFAFDPDLLSRKRIIASFLAQVEEALKGTGVLLSADIFGVVAWGREADIASTGQQLSDMLPFLDAVSPMLYPSHFYGEFERRERPVDCPYYILHRGCLKMREMAAEHRVNVRPWVQAFPYRVSDFDELYVERQLRGAEAGGARGWLLWNPASNYGVGLEAIRKMGEEGREVEQEECPPAGPEEEPVEASGDCCNEDLRARF